MVAGSEEPETSYRVLLKANVRLSSIPEAGAIEATFDERRHLGFLMHGSHSNLLQGLIT